jgi:hypothetical protein
MPKKTFEKNYIFSTEKKTKPENTEESILTDTHLSNDQKIKLLNQHRHLKPPSRQTKQKIKKIKTIGIFENIAYEYKPFIHNIIQIIKKKPQKISWDDNFTLILNNELIPDTDVKILMQYISNGLIITRDSEIPKAADEFIESLIALGVPDAWIKIKSKRRKSQRTQPQRGRQLQRGRQQKRGARRIGQAAAIRSPSRSPIGATGPSPSRSQSPTFFSPAGSPTRSLNSPWLHFNK